MPLIFVFWVEVSVFCIGVLDNGIWSSAFCVEIVELLCRACLGLPLTSSGAKGIVWLFGFGNLASIDWWQLGWLLCLCSLDWWTVWWGCHNSSFEYLTSPLLDNHYIYALVNLTVTIMVVDYCRKMYISHTCQFSLRSAATAIVLQPLLNPPFAKCVCYWIAANANKTRQLKLHCWLNYITKLPPHWSI